MQENNKHAVLRRFISSEKPDLQVRLLSGGIEGELPFLSFSLSLQFATESESCDHTLTLTVAA